MPLVTPQFVFDLESRMRMVQVNDMARLMASENQWWDTCTKRTTTGSRRDVITWILETASIQTQGRFGGNIALVMPISRRGAGRCTHRLERAAKNQGRQPVQPGAGNGAS